VKRYLSLNDTYPSLKQINFTNAGGLSCTRENKRGKDETKESNKSRKGNNDRSAYVHHPGRNHIALIIYYPKINFLKKIDRGTVDESCIEKGVAFYLSKEEKIDEPWLINCIQKTR
jgi:hypothetical protein